MDKIPAVITFIRDALTSILSMVSLQDYFQVSIFALAIFLAYLWMKQFITQSALLKFSTILNWILLALLIFICLVYVK
jgi:hypothetical protein